MTVVKLIQLFRLGLFVLLHWSSRRVGFGFVILAMTARASLDPRSLDAPYFTIDYARCYSPSRSGQLPQALSLVWSVLQ